jgi:hypothetical protein
VLAGFGFRCHSGWATLVLATGSAPQGEVVARRRVPLIEPGVARQPYHAAEPLALARAESLIARALASVARATRHSLSAALEHARATGLDVRCAGVLLGSGRPLPSLDKVLRSHALIHAAEGELYRDAIRDACEAAGLRVVGIRDKQVGAWAAKLLGGPQALAQRLASLGRVLGPPWREDEKHAALAAWAALGRGAAPARPRIGR